MAGSAAELAAGLSTAADAWSAGDADRHDAAELLASFVPADRVEAEVDAAWARAQAFVARPTVMAVIRELADSAVVACENEDGPLLDEACEDLVLAAFDAVDGGRALWEAGEPRRV